MSAFMGAKPASYFTALKNFLARRSANAMVDKPRTAEEIVADLRTSSAAYADAARKEGEVWGKMFSDRDFLAIRQDEQAAAAELGLNRDKPPGLHRMLALAGLKPRRGLSLGCGSGRAERLFLKQGVCERFTGVDVAEAAIEEARQTAAAENLPIDYLCQDLNALDLGDQKFDLVVCQTILHHVLDLEHVFDEIERALAPDGLFYVHDYIGETQFQFTDERLRWYNSVMQALPESLRANRLCKVVPAEIRRPEPGKLVSPFEAIRSGEIRGMLLERFEVLEKHESTTILDRVVPTGSRRGYLADENTRAVFELLFLLDRALLEGGLLAPVEGRYLLRRKR
jgi:SAM-dependent methyltransferase